ncbi:MAG: hypothetical protein A2X34_03330 [Elusimicrobia bacterium GWC2_51_8]|nr:MAG: hypothetical protein A2X33_07305 [Elusimicrobia bacterium GWA2_51_34]OGR59432.1 MAG: hypothetical protein A2X34_03330 [Elusimicrobia bacterium GWC2_51_8]HCE96935.1 hypothetical protein [Elusimicrobiota bacterium]
MSTDKKCYKCLKEVDKNEKVCPRCNAQLGARTESGVAGKPGSPLLKIFFAVLALTIAGKTAMHSNSDNSADALVQISNISDSIKYDTIQKIKEKGAKELSAVGVADINYKGDTLCVYVDQRYNNLSRPQQEQLLAIMAGEWEKALGKNSTEIKILEYGTNKTLAELVV